MPFIGQQPQSGAYSALDSITTSATDTYNLTLDGSAYYPQSANQLLVSLNGVLQAPNTSYNVSGSQIVFSSALTSSDVIDFITALGNTYDIGTPTDGTVSTAKIATGAVTSAKLDTNIDIAGTLDVTGALTADSNATVAGTLDVTGALTADSNATVAGNLTVDTNTLYVDSTNNRVGIGTATPDFDLEVYKTTTAEVAIGSDNGGTAQLSFYENNSTTKEFYVKYDGTGNNGVIGTSGAANAIVIARDTGNVGIGTTSMTRFFNLYDTSSNATTAYIKNTSASGGSGILCYNDSGQAAAFQLNGSSNSSYAGGNTLNIGSVTNNTVAFLQNNTEKMRIDTNGNLLVGTTNTNNNTEDGLRLYGGAKYASFTRNGGAPCALVRRSSGGEILEFFYNSTKVGTVSISTTNTSYNTSSDYRLKENVIEVTDGIDRVKLLKPSRFNFISDPDKTVDGFLAHEVQDVVPEAIFGTKDGIRTEDVYDEDGNVTGTQEVPEYQGIDQSKLVPLLTAALQEAIAKIESLEARVATLESA